MKRRIINPWSWQETYGYQQALEITNGQQMLVCSGQTPNDDAGEILHVGDMARQITLALDNMEDVLTASGWSMSDVVQIKIYTTDMDRFLEEDGVLVSRYLQAGMQVTQTLIGVTRLAHPDMMVEIEAVALR